MLSEATHRWEWHPMAPDSVSPEAHRILVRSEGGVSSTLGSTIGKCQAQVEITGTSDDQSCGDRSSLLEQS
jgi:hypothetical protein